MPQGNLPVKLSNVLRESVVKVGLESQDRDEVFEEMVDLLARAGRITDRRGVVEAVRAREKIGSTGLGRGVAVPHARQTLKDPSVTTLTVALGISHEGIEYDATDGEPVHLVYLSLADRTSTLDYVLCLGEIARLLKLPGFYDRLVREAETPADVLRVIGEME